MIAASVAFWSAFHSQQNSALVGIRTYGDVYGVLRHSLLETMLAMPTQEVWMRPLECPRRHDRASGPVYQPSYTLWIIGMPRNQDVEVIGQADQATVEHPVRRAGQRDAIGQDIGPFRLNRPYVRCIDFGASPAVDELQASDCTALVVGLYDEAAEQSITDNP